MIKRVILNREQFFQLTELIREPAFKEKLLAERPPWTVAAEWCAARLSFPVTDVHVREACYLVGLEWDTPLRRGLKDKKDRVSQLEIKVARLDPLEAKVTELAADNAHLSRLVRHLYHELNARPPAGYTISANALRALPSDDLRTPSPGPVVVNGI